VVDVSERFEHVNHGPPGLLFGKAPLVENPLEELAPSQEGEGEVVVVGRLEPAEREERWGGWKESFSKWPSRGEA
jgi:hypothetical protein